MREKWKRAFEIDPESTTESHRIEVTARRKSWLVRAWTYFFGFLPNAIPAYNEKKGFFHTPAIMVQFHHIVPIQESLRLFGEDNDFYNDKRNIAPISELNHIAVGADEFDFVIHSDMRGINKLYGEYREGKIANPYQTMGINRKLLTDAGLPYHEVDYDMYLLDLADMVCSKYEVNYPDDRY